VFWGKKKKKASLWKGGDKDDRRGNGGTIKEEKSWGVLKQCSRCEGKGGGDKRRVRGGAGKMAMVGEVLGGRGGKGGAGEKTRKKIRNEYEFLGATRGEK